jgi:hypothetical protein
MIARGTLFDRGPACPAGRGGSAHAHDTTVIAPRRSRRQTNTGTLRRSGLSSSSRCTGQRGSQIVMKRDM